MNAPEASANSLSQPLLEEVIELDETELYDFCGPNDRKIRELEGQFGVRIVPRGNKLKLIGSPDEVAKARQGIGSLLALTRERPGLTPTQFKAATEAVKAARAPEMRAAYSDRVQVASRKRSISPLTPGQKAYIDAIRRSDIVFGIGPAGTGKTYLAMALAVNYLINNRVRRIVLVRPAVEAGEKLGFLPGDIAAKFDPYVRPLYDALHDMVEPERAKQLLETGVVEVAPLAFMRGRTLNSSFVILDEAQNTTVEQMKMLLTRLGYDSKAVITGDVTQIDLPVGKESGLIHVQSVLKDIQGIDFVRFDQRDVVRHGLVQLIVKAYEKAELQRAPIAEELPFMEAEKPLAPAEPDQIAK